MATNATSQQTKRLPIDSVSARRVQKHLANKGLKAYIVSENNSFTGSQDYVVAELSGGDEADVFAETATILGRQVEVHGENTHRIPM